VGHVLPRKRKKSPRVRKGRDSSAGKERSPLSYGGKPVSLDSYHQAKKNSWLTGERNRGIGKENLLVAGEAERAQKTSNSFSGRGKNFR